MDKQELIKTIEQDLGQVIKLLHENKWSRRNPDCNEI